MPYETLTPIAPPSNNKQKLLIFIVVILLIFAGVTGFFLWQSAKPTPPGPGPGTLPPSREDKEAPTTPSNLIATVVSDTAVLLSWATSTDDVGVEGYRVYRDGTLAQETKTTRYADSALRPLVEYTYVVTAFDKARHESLASEEVRVKTSDASVAETITLETTSGKPISVRNFYKDVVEITEEDVIIRDTDYYALIFFPRESSFIITLNDSNVRRARAIAENDTLEILGISKENICTLKIYITIPFDVNEAYSKESYGFSFCPNAKQFQ